MLPEIEKKLEWDYNVPRCYAFKIKEDENCSICRNAIVSKWLSPFLISDIPYDKIISILKNEFNFDVTENILTDHKNHIEATYTGDDAIKKKAMEDIATIEADLVGKTNEEMVIESAIRSLYARKLFYEKTGTYDREYREILAELNKWVTLKAKMKDKIVDQTVRVSLSDIINLNIGGKNERPNDDTTGTKSSN
jgi:hypothetical protein